MEGKAGRRKQKAVSGKQKAGSRKRKRKRKKRAESHIKIRTLSVPSLVIRIKHVFIIREIRDYKNPDYL